jgi:hypothetical protein
VLNRVKKMNYFAGIIFGTVKLVNMKTIAIRYGLYFFAGLVAIFLSSYLIGIADNYYFRFTNGIVHMAALYYGIKAFRLQWPDTIHNYVSGVGQGMYIGAVGSLLFGIFLLFFLLANPIFMAELQTSTNLGADLTPITSAIITVVEGIAVSLIGSYLLTRYVDSRSEQKAKNWSY